jgi:threonine dehydratase
MGKILCGFELPPDASEEDFQQFLDSLGYNYVDESDNVVYKRFL